MSGKYYYEFQVKEGVPVPKVIGHFVSGDVITFAIQLPRRKAKGYRKHVRRKKSRAL